MGLPDKVSIVEVGPRDGFQNVKQFIPTEDKILIIKNLIDTGLTHLEVTSFVHPKWVPQMADAVDVVKGIQSYAKDREVELIALVPNKYGALKAYELGLDTITYVISVSEAHNFKNVNRTVAESLRELEDIVKSIGKMKVRLAIATTFGCPFGEEIAVERIINMAQRGLSLDCSKILLADTVGLANPLQVKSIIHEVSSYIPGEKLGVHFHDTRAMALANTFAALDGGIMYFESSIGGLGGCPFAPGAAGNVATEDLVNMIHSMDIKTGIDMNKLLNVVKMVKRKVDAPLLSHMAMI